jgi:hypothetical protein
MESRRILIYLLLKLGVAVVVSSTLVRSKEFKSCSVSRGAHLPAKTVLSALVRPADHGRRRDPIFQNQLLRAAT